MIPDHAARPENLLETVHDRLVEVSQMETLAPAGKG